MESDKKFETRLIITAELAITNKTSPKKTAKVLASPQKIREHKNQANPSIAIVPFLTRFAFSNLTSRCFPFLHYWLVLDQASTFGSSLKRRTHYRSKIEYGKLRWVNGGPLSLASSLMV